MPTDHAQDPAQRDETEHSRTLRDRITEAVVTARARRERVDEAPAAHRRRRRRADLPRRIPVRGDLPDPRRDLPRGAARAALPPARVLHAERLAAIITVLGTLAVIVGLFSFVVNQSAAQLPDLVGQVGQGVDQAEVGTRAAQAGLTVDHLLAGAAITMFALFFFRYDGPQI